MLKELGVGIRHRVRKVYLFDRVFKSVCKAEHVKFPLAATIRFLRNLRLAVFDIRNSVFSPKRGLLRSLH